MKNLKMHIVRTTIGGREAISSIEIQNQEGGAYAVLVFAPDIDDMLKTKTAKALLRELGSHRPIGSVDD